MPEVDLSKMSDTELEKLNENVVETRARRSIEKQKIQGGTFDLDDIRPGMSQQEISAAWAAVSKAVRGDK